MTTEERILQKVTAGNLQSRVTILAPSATVDSRGNQKITYTAGPSVWAYIETHASQIYETTDEVHIIRKMIIVMRYRPGLTPEHRFKFSDRIFKPIGAPIDAKVKHQWTYIECIEEVKNL